MTAPITITSTNDIADSRHASTLGRYGDAVDDYLRGRRSSLKEFEGRRIRTAKGEYLEFVADLELVEFLAQAGEMSFEDLYSGTG